MASLEDFLVERFYGLFTDKQKALDRHVDASAVAFDFTPQEMLNIELAATATYFEVDMHNLTKKHVNLANGIALDPIEPGELIQATKPLVLFLPPLAITTMQEYVVPFYAAFFVAEAAWVIKAVALYPKHVLKDTKWPKLLEACLTLYVTFGEVAEKMPERPCDELNARLLLFALMATKSSECLHRCGHMRLMGPDHFQPVRDDMRPNAAFFGNNLRLPFSCTHMEAGTCGFHERAWVLYAQQPIAMGEFVTVARTNPFMAELDDIYHPAQFLPMLSSKSPMATYKEDSIQKEMHGLLQKPASEERLNRVSTLIMDLALLFNNFEPTHASPWPAAITFTGTELFNILDNYVRRLPPGQSKTTACKVVDRFAVPAFASFQWPSILVDMYYTMHVRSEYATTAEKILNALPAAFHKEFVVKCLQASM